MGSPHPRIPSCGARTVRVGRECPVRADAIINARRCYGRITNVIAKENETNGSKVLTDLLRRTAYRHGQGRGDFGSKIFGSRDQQLVDLALLQRLLAA